MPGAGRSAILDTTPANLITEIEAAERLRDARLAKWCDFIDSYVGPGYRAEVGENALLENHFYEYLSLMIPKIIFDNPRASCKSKRAGKGRIVASAIEHALNRWVEETQYRNHLLTIGSDAVFAFGMSMIVPQAMPGYDPTEQGIPYWPQAIRISPQHAIIDPLAKTFMQSRYRGHMWVRDKEDLIREAEENPQLGWNVGLLSELTESESDNKKLARRTIKNLNVERHEVVGYDIWVPEKYSDVQDHPGPEEGYHGTTYTMLAAQGASKEPEDFIREPRSFYGPRVGPYTMFGIYSVPDEVYPLSPLQGVWTQVNELNLHAKSASKNAQNYKRQNFVDATATVLEKAIRDSPHDYTIPIPGLKDSGGVQTVETGGISEHDIEMLNLLRERLHRVSGMTDTMRGNIDEDATATAESIAQDASSARTAFIKKQITDAVQNELGIVAWYLYHDDRVVFPLGEEAALDMANQLRESAQYNAMVAQQIQMIEMENGKPLEKIIDPEFHGGLHESDSGARYEDLSLEIDPYSMERTDETLMQQRAIQMLEAVTQIAPLIVTSPQVDWRKLLEKVGDAMNDADWGKIINVDMAAQMGGLPGAMFQADPTAMTGRSAGQGPPQMQQQQQPGQPQRQPQMMGNQRGGMYAGAQRTGR